MVYESYSPEDTAHFAAQLSLTAKAGDIFCLSGDLGAGKTAFVKGFAEGLGVQSPVTSPTFTIIQEYAGGRLPLYHFDVYRLNGEDEMEDIGYEEYFDGCGVCMVEWAEIIKDLIPDTAVRILMEKDLKRGDQYRSIRIFQKGSETV